MSKVKKGYKDTEFGIIPNDWNIDTFGNLLEGFTSGATPYRAIPSFYNGNILWISSGELNYNWITDTIEHISLEAQKRTNLKKHPVGTFLMAITGLEAEGTRGRCAFIGKPATTNQSCLAIYPTAKLATEYLFYFYRQYANYLAFKYSQGTKQQSYTAKIAKQLPICCPSDIQEQQAIAEALSDIDTLINALNRQIEKKKNIKQGAMQELLTGQKKLQGFKEEFKETIISSIGKPYNGITGKTKENFGKGEAFYIPFVNVLNNTIINTSQLEKVDIKNYENQNTVIKGDLLFNTSSETPEEVGLCSVMMEDIDSLYLNSFCFGFRVINQDMNPLFLSHFFRSRHGRDLMLMLSQGSTRYNLSKSAFLKSFIRIPSTKEEQTAIAQILTDMDNEIEQLEKKRDKYLNIKSGMMQQLLTGQIRLLNQEVKKESKVIDIRSTQLKKHSKQFDDAVVISFLVNKFTTKGQPLSRFLYTKYSYLIHRKQTHSTAEYKKFAAGPYNPTTKYGGPEKIGQENKYFYLVKDNNGYDAFVAGENIQEAVDYFAQWYGEDTQDWIEQFQDIKPWDLETLATVDMAVYDLREMGIESTVASVKAYLSSISKWQAKLNKSHFSDRHIQHAIDESIRLFKI